MGDTTATPSARYAQVLQGRLGSGDFPWKSELLYCRQKALYEQPDSFLIMQLQ